MEKIQVSIEKMLYEPYHNRSILAKWELDNSDKNTGLKLFETLKAKTVKLRELIDNERGWQYYVKDAVIMVDNNPLQIDGEIILMPSWDMYSHFLNILDKEIMEEEYYCELSKEFSV